MRTGTPKLPLAPSLPPEVRQQAAANVDLSRRHIGTTVTAQVPVIVSPLSHCYLDLPSAEPSSSRRKPTVRAASVYGSMRPRPLRNRSAGTQPERSGLIEPTGSPVSRR